MVGDKRRPPPARVSSEGGSSGVVEDKPPSARVSSKGAKGGGGEVVEDKRQPPPAHVSSEGGGGGVVGDKTTPSYIRKVGISLFCLISSFDLLLPFSSFFFSDKSYWR